MDYGKLPYTGVGLIVGGASIGLQWFVVAAAMLVIVGAVLVRVGWRSGKTVSDK